MLERDKPLLVRIRPLGGSWAWPWEGGVEEQESVGLDP